MPENRFGTDLKLSDDGDLIIKPNGDLMTSQDYENTKSNVKFTGYYSVLGAVMNRLMTAPGTYPFDPTYGSDLQARISQPINAGFENDVAVLVRQALLSDDRVREVVSVTAEIIANSIIVVRAKVILIGTSVVSDLVFPEMFIS